ncbi:hypothetical protein BDZ45DRAFT_691465 [Acephala macrosclerotiorum]|nr:hypothetical protein BDZ45DRAFT_691465 [Acephala macrosclerotiorum]
MPLVPAQSLVPKKLLVGTRTGSAIIPDCVEGVSGIDVAVRDYRLVSDLHLEVKSNCWRRTVVADIDVRTDGAIFCREYVVASLPLAGEEAKIFLSLPYVDDLKFGLLRATQLARMTASSGLASANVDSNPSGNAPYLLIDVYMLQMKVLEGRKGIELSSAGALRRQDERYEMLCEG